MQADVITSERTYPQLSAHEQAQVRNIVNSAEGQARIAAIHDGACTPLAAEEREAKFGYFAETFPNLAAAIVRHNEQKRSA